MFSQATWVIVALAACVRARVFSLPPFPSFIPADAFQRREALTLRKFNGSCINLLF